MAVFDRRRFCILGLALLSVACQPGESGPQQQDRGMDSLGMDSNNFEALNQAWRERRLERLTAPYGWLSLSGLFMLEAGRHSIGSAGDNQIVLDHGPARWGSIELTENQRVWFEAAAGSGVTLEGRPVERIELELDGDAGSTTLEADRIRIHLVDPGGRLGLRVRDPEARPRAEFAGLDYYPLDAEWWIEAKFEPHPPGTTLQIANVLGQLIDEPNPGRVRFEHQGQHYSLEAVLEDDQLFFIFADRTSGRETYGLGRFLYAALPVDGRVLLDFNQAYNPPCAFNAFTTCPLPPASNRMDVSVRAGERAYAGTPGIRQPRPVEP